MAIFLPRGGSFTWGRSGLMRWCPPVVRRHELGARVAISSRFPGPTNTDWLSWQPPSGGRVSFCSFATQFGGDFEFNLEVRTNTSHSLVHSYLVIAAINGVDYLSMSHSTPSGFVFVSPFKMTLFGVPPHAVIEFSVVNTSSFRLQISIAVLPVFSDRVGLLVPQTLLQSVSLSRENIQGESVSQVSADLSQTPPIRVISPSAPVAAFVQ